MDAKARRRRLEGPAGITPRLRAMLLAIGLFAVVGIFAAWKWWPQAHGPPSVGFAPAPVPEDPRLTYDTPFRNVRPDVKYVGDEACARSTRAPANSYHNHPTWRSLTLLETA